VLRPRAEAPVPYSPRRSGTGFGGSAGGGSGPLAQMGRVGTLFAIVNRTSTATAAPDWGLYRKAKPGKATSDTERERVTVHAALTLWENPNPFMTQADLIEIGQQHVDLAGETLLVVVRKGNIPVELWPVRPDRMEPVKHPTEFLLGWTYKTPDGDKIPLAADEVIQIKMPNPEDPYRGMGPVQAILVELEASTAAAAWNAAFFRNSAEPGGVIELENNLDDDEWEQFTRRWAEQHRGVSNAHRVAVIEHGAKWVDRKYTQRDMQFAELRNVSRDVLMEAYGMSRATLGVTDGVNFAAAKAADAQFAKLLTVPRLERWRQALNTRLLPMFGATGKGVEFDYESPVASDEEAANAERDSVVRAAAELIRAGFNADDVRAAYGLPEMRFGSGEASDPQRTELLQLLQSAPAALGDRLLPVLYPNIDWAAVSLPAPAASAAAPEPPVPGTPPASDPSTGGREPGTGTTNRHPDAEGWDCTGGHGVACVHHDVPRAPLRAEGAPDVDLAPVQAAYERRLAQLLDRMADVRADWRADLRRQIAAAIDDNDLPALAALAVDPAPAQARIVEAMRAIAGDAAAQVKREAAAQGVSLALPGRVSATTAPVPDDDVAATLAALMAAAQALTAGTEAMRVNYNGGGGAEVAGQVEATLTEASTAREDTKLGGVLTGAQNRARIDTMASGPSGSIYADETLDGNTCPRCRAIDGRFVCTTDDLGPYDKLYTAIGGYVDCDGRERCRGTVTGVWRPETTTPPAPARPASPPGPRTTLDDWADEVAALADIDQPDDHDAILARILSSQDFDALPTVLSAAAFAALSDDHVEVYRGIAGSQAEQWAREFRTGRLFTGLGTYGNGTYTTTDESAAEGYAAGRGWRGADEDGVVMRMALRPDARVISLSDLREIAAADERLQSGDFGKAFGDPGRLAAALGYDALVMTPDPGESERYYVVLNRGALVVEAP
jgi:HK97 family phage portal protein